MRLVGKPLPEVDFDGVKVLKSCKTSANLEQKKLGKSVEVDYVFDFSGVSLAQVLALAVAQLVIAQQRTRRLAHLTNIDGKTVNIGVAQSLAGVDRVSYKKQIEEKDNEIERLKREIERLKQGKKKKKK